MKFTYEKNGMWAIIILLWKKKRKGEEKKEQRRRKKEKKRGGERKRKKKEEKEVDERKKSEEKEIKGLRNRFGKRLSFLRDYNLFLSSFLLIIFFPFLHFSFFLSVLFLAKRKKDKIERVGRKQNVLLLPEAVFLKNSFLLVFLK